jgi:hypothetical protein
VQPIVFQVVGQYSFGLGVLYGIGENIVGSVVELGQLVKTLLLADLYDCAHRSAFAAVSSPVGVLQQLIADVSMRAAASELEAARTERDELVAELRYAMTHLGEVVEGIGASYVAKWTRFETLSQERTLSSQFEAGRIFGEVLLEVLSLIGGGVVAIKAASKIPKLVKLAKLKIPAKTGSRGSSGAPETLAREQTPSTPSTIRRAEQAIDERPGPGPRPRKPAELGESIGKYARPAEQRTAKRLADRYPEFDGRTFEAPPPPDPGYDWIDDLGRKYDALGDGTKSKYFNLDDFTESIDWHLLKGNEFTVIDMTGYTADQIGAVSQYVDALAAAKQAMIRRVGF